MKNLQISLFVAALIAFGSGCGGGNARTPEQWTEDTYKLFEDQSGPIKTCYERELEKNPSLEGKVTVSFVIRQRTGQLIKPRIVSSGTTVGDPARRCVLKTLEDLKLTPPDSAQGQGTFTWEFKRDEQAPSSPST